MFYTGASRKPTLPLHHGRTWPKTAHSGGMPLWKVWTLLRRGSRRQQGKGTESITTKLLLLLHHWASPTKYAASSACQRLVCTATPECNVQTLLSERNHHHLMWWIAMNKQMMFSWSNRFHWLDHFWAFCQSYSSPDPSASSGSMMVPDLPKQGLLNWP